MKKVALGLSGGIDSTVAALLLKDAGYEVTGITMSIWDEASPLAGKVSKGCYSPAERHSLERAAEACERLGIRHLVIPLQEVFRDRVLTYFRQTYASGRTPNPCVRCNRFLKFEALPQGARDLGLDFDWFATGHYVRKLYDPDSQRWQMLRAHDKGKDQSYFLSFLSQEQLAKTLFPLGELSKAEVRRIASQRGFGHLLQQKESQDFLAAEDYALLFDEQDYVPGIFIDAQGKLLGRHKGLIHYTIGQRKNLGISGQPQALYVTRIDPQSNQITLGAREELYTQELMATGLNWVSIPTPVIKIRCQAQIRYQHQAAECELIPLGDKRFQVLFDQAQPAITPGQIVAFYQREIVLGGGVIA